MGVAVNACCIIQQTRFQINCENSPNLLKGPKLKMENPGNSIHHSASPMASGLFVE